MTTWSHTSTDSAPCIDADGNEYSTVKLGRQEWMTENLKTTKYNDGSDIERVTSSSDWSALSTGARCEYSNDTDNSDIYGYLYNRMAVETDKLAPNGWRVPILNDYKELERYLGMSAADSDVYTGGTERGTDEGSELAGRADLWDDDDLESNSNFGTSGFNALPAGRRPWNTGTFYNINTDAYFWTTTELSWLTAESYIRWIQHDHDDLHAGSGRKQNGYSVRCIRNEVSPWSAKYPELKWHTWGTESTDFWQEWG